MAKISRALLSVSDKTGLIPLAETLAQAGVQLISTGGTAKTLRAAGLEVTDLSDYTGFPELLDGRVKTLHPRVHGGLLFLRDNPTHCQIAAEHRIDSIDLVVVNLYPFEATVARPDATWDEAIENIDIGGPAMLRSAAKNHHSVTVLTDPEDYDSVAEHIRLQGNTNLKFRRWLATKAFIETAAYDNAIARYLLTDSNDGNDNNDSNDQSSSLPQQLSISASRSKMMRYGENPHQQAALYGEFDDYFRHLHGKALSYNNLLDLTAAAELVQEFDDSSAVLAILKHTNPCGVGQGATLKEAWEKAFATDRQAPFGGIIAVNQPLDAPCAQAIAGIFSEVIVAPRFTPEAQEILAQKKNLRLIRLRKSLSQDTDDQPTWTRLRVRSTGFGMLLVQEPDQKPVNDTDWKTVTDRSPTPTELEAMKFGWRIVKHVKSNAIVHVAPDRTLGIGAGQMSRVDAGKIAVTKAKNAELQLTGSIVCSDAFYPFPDGLTAAAEAGATAAIQPGGSKRDKEVIAAANQYGMAMVFTGQRHFRH